MNTLIIYDNTGYVISTTAGSIREPQGGVQFLWVEIQDGKQLKITDGIGVDVTKTPHQAILEDIPPTEIENLRADLNSAVMELSTLIAMGGTV